MFEFHGETYVCDEVVGVIDGYEDDPFVYGLFLDFNNDGERLIQISIQDPNGDRDGLLVEGVHHATGNHIDRIFNYMSPNVFSIGYLDSTRLSLEWEQVEIDGGKFSGHGYVNFHERLGLACADSIWFEGGFVGPGHPEYDNYFENYCAPGYYYPAQRISFTCKDGLRYGVRNR